jgi:subtilase family serine protease
MKLSHWFIHSKLALSPLRIAIAGAFIVASGTMAFVASNTSNPVVSKKSDRKGPAIHHTMSPVLRMGSQETFAGMQAGIGTGPLYGLFTCQVGRSVGQCYDPYEMRHAYQTDSLIAAGYDGTGHTIVIVDAFQNPNLVSQVAHFDAFYGLPAISLTQYAPDGLTPFVTGDPNMTGWAEEISLDVEYAHGIAPGARIALVLAKSNSDADIVSALKYAVDHNLGDVISMSFGGNESCLDPDTLSAYHDVFAAATQKNITLVASSGDTGAAQTTCDGNSWVQAVSFPASDPLVTGVGGTELHAADYCLTSLGCNPSTHPSPGTYQSEIVWNEGLPFGDFGNVFGFGTVSTGGGFSVVFDEPPYQKGTDGLHGGKQRAVPDVAYSAAVLHGVLVYLNIPGLPPGFYRIGGTSAGAPQWAAITAIANQKAGGRLGFLNSAIYQIGKVKKAYPVSFNDITSGTNSSLQFDSSNNPVTVIGFDAGIGWDATTGTGSPVTSSLADYLIKYVSPGDGNAAVATTKPKPHQKPIVSGGMRPH